MVAAIAVVAIIFSRQRVGWNEMSNLLFFLRGCPRGQGAIAGSNQLQRNNFFKILCLIFKTHADLLATS